MMKLVEINRFEVMSNSGNRIVVIEYQEFIDASTGGHPNATIPGLKIYETINGDHVNPLDANTFKVLGFDEVYRKII